LPYFVVSTFIHLFIYLFIPPDFGMVAIIVVCVGFLLFMIILGVVRIRAAHRRTQVVHVEEKQEMEWDNSALNITVNPVEQEAS
jgi:multisubunit Na+/H+ antiporter MnhB subunit